MSGDIQSPDAPEVGTSSLVTRGVIGGVLMGLANLVPGISGGTMLVAAGVYKRFINAIAELSTLKFKRASIVLLAAVVLSAATSIVLLAGPVKTLVVENGWIMYSLFIGLTLGGVPVVWRMLDRPSVGTWIGAVAGFAGMAALAVVQASETGGASSTGFVMMLFAGTVAAGAMILPGISGGYLFLVLGVYVPVLSAIDELKVAVKARDLAAAMGPGLDVVLPVGIGVVVGVVVVSNLLKMLLARYERPTLGVLLGLLVGAVAGLWPFQEGVKPAVGEMFRGQALTVEALAKLVPSKYPKVFFSPSAGQIAGALALVVLGVALTSLVARLGRGKEA